jgi:hypothetical protein
LLPVDLSVSLIETILFRLLQAICENETQS